MEGVYQRARIHAQLDLGIASIFHQGQFLKVQPAQSRLHLTGCDRFIDITFRWHPMTFRMVTFQTRREYRNAPIFRTMAKRCANQRGFTALDSAAQLNGQDSSIA